MTKKIGKKYVVGVDGGGTKTIAALADLNGKILKLTKTGPSNLRNVGIKKAAENIALAIKKVLPKKGKILSTFIGLAAVEEEYKFKIPKIKKELKKHKEISKIFERKIEINSDQKVAFRAGADEDGVALNAGTGCVAHGWKRLQPIRHPPASRTPKEAHASGWGWLGDEGGAFFVGQKVFQVILKDLDGRGSKTLLTKFIFKKLKLKSEEDFLNIVYQKNPIEILPRFSIFCNEASKKRDKVAKEILIEAAKEAGLTAKAVIKKLNFQKEEFPLVLVGGMFKSKIFFKTVKIEIKKFAPKAKFILLKRKPVIGAVELAIENLK